jgi:hypothetical protein
VTYLINGVWIRALPFCVPGGLYWDHADGLLCKKEYDLGKKRKATFMENNPLDQLSPEVRQRVEQSLQALGGGVTPQNIFVSQYPSAIPDHVPQGAQPRSQHASGSSGQGWAHWEYDPYEWAAFDQVDWEPIRNKSRLTLILSPIIYLVIMVVPWVLFVSSAPIVMLGLVMLGPAIVLLTGLIILMASAANSAKEAKKRYQARHNPAESHRVTLASNGVWESGVYFSLKSGRWGLDSVKLTANPAVLHFKLLKRNSDGSWAGSTQKLHVLVPRGHEAEAEQLRQRYYAEVIAPWKKPVTYNPPEPR